MKDHDFPAYPTRKPLQPLAQVNFLSNEQFAAEAAHSTKRCGVAEYE